MSTIVKLFVSLCLYFTTQTIAAQGWVKITGLPEKEFSALEVIDGTLYTATGKTLYTSTDEGSTWAQSNFTSQNNVRVRCFKKFNGKIYAGTSKGIFSADIESIHDAWSYDLQAEHINSFTERDNVLYASMEVFGTLILNGTAWMPFTTGIPDYSMSVTEVLNTPAGLLAIAGANGTFYRFNFNQNTWIEDYYINNGLSAGLDVDDIISIGNNLYVSRFNNIYRSDDMGETWVEDKLGLMTGQTRTIYATENDMYSISVIGTDTTRLNKRGINDVGTSWANDVDVLPFFTFAMRKLDGNLFIAALDGVYTTNGTLGTPHVSELITTVYPNPSADGHFMIQSNTIINSIKIYDSTGRLILSKQNDNGMNEFSIQQNGFYIVELEANGAVSIQKIIVK